MRKNMVFKSVLAVTVVAMLGYGAIAYAGMYGNGPRGYGGGQGYGCGQGYGPQHRGNNRGGGCLAYNNLTDEQRAKLDAERETFWKASDDLRRQRQQKSLVLQSILLGNPIDEEKATSVQTEISSLDAQLDQAWIGHIINMKKIAPDFNWGPMGSGKKGPGRQMMGDNGYPSRGFRAGLGCGR